MKLESIDAQRLKIQNFENKIKVEDAAVVARV